MKPAIVLLTVMFALITSAAADPVDTVRCREIAFSVAVETGDAATFTSLIDNDARFVGNSVLRGPAAITEAWSTFFSESGPEIKWRPQFVEVLADGQLALTRGPYRMVIKDQEGNETELWGTFNSVWRLHDDGQWKVVFDAGSDPAETPTDEVKALLDRQDSCEG
jgi:ketosteroid isomerase-like protein